MRASYPLNSVTCTCAFKKLKLQAADSRLFYLFKDPSYELQAAPTPRSLLYTDLLLQKTSFLNKAIVTDMYVLV
jgi:hypothetical protein